MPDVDAADARRGGRLPSLLFWAGVGLAPLAGLLLLLGNGAALRLGGLLGVLTVVLIGASMSLRPDPSAVRLLIEETLLEEIDILRGELREEIANSSRVTHQTVGERLGAMQQTVDSLRTERAGPVAGPVTASAAAAVPQSVPAVRSAPAGWSSPPASADPAYSAASPPYPAGYAAVPAQSAPPPQSAPPRSVPPRSAPAQPASPPQSAPPRGRYPAAAPVSAPTTRTPNGRASAAAPPGRRGGSRGERDLDSQRPAPADAASGAYQHAEAVPVTRSSYVDEQPRNGHRRRRYGDDDPDYAGPEWSTVVPRSQQPASYQEPPWADEKPSWTDEKLRERYGGRSSYERDGDRGGAGDSWGTGQWPPVSGTPVSRGRAARHSGENGHDARVEDRWPAARRDDGVDRWDGGLEGRGAPDRRGREAGDGGLGQPRYGEVGYGAAGAGYGRPDYSRRALPAASSEPSWNDSWDEPAEPSRGHRYRPDGEDDYGANGARRRRQFDFELTDERWR